MIPDCIYLSSVKLKRSHLKVESTALVNMEQKFISSLFHTNYSVVHLNHYSKLHKNTRLKRRWLAALSYRCF